MPALITGFALAFARGVGEYGSVIFIAGNQPYKTEIAPLMIISRLEEYDYAGATTIAVVMLAALFCHLFLINLVTSMGKPSYRENCTMSLNTNSNALGEKLQSRDATREPTWVRYTLICNCLDFFLSSSDFAADFGFCPSV